MTRNFTIVLMTALLIAGCGRDEAEQAPAEAQQSQDAASASTALFDRIDADTPLLFANLQTLPEDLSERLWKPMEAFAEINRTSYETIAEEIDSALASALMEEMFAIDSRAALAERGLHPNGHWAMHTVSVFPFVHWQLSDSDAFAAMLERIAEKASSEAGWRTIDDQRLLWIDFDAFGVALHHDQDYATAALVPDNLALLRRVANLDQPASAFDPDDLAEFGRERGHTAYGSGFVEFKTLFNVLLDSDDEMLTAAEATAPMAEIGNDPACRAELDALAATFPRISFGYTEVSAERMGMDLIFETDAAFGQRLSAIAQAPVSLTGRESGVFDFGLAFNMVAARDFARELVAGWVENPPQCSLFNNIAVGAEDWQTALNQPIPPVVTNLYGLRLGVDSLQLGENAVPVDAGGIFTLHMRNPQMLLGMAQMFSPELASLQLEPGGEPVELPASLLQGMPSLSAYAALGSDALGIAIGESQRSQLPSALEPTEGDNALMHYGLNFEGYSKVMSTLMNRMAEQLQEANPESDMVQAADAMNILGEIYEYSGATVFLTERGIEVRSMTRLAPQ